MLLRTKAFAWKIYLSNLKNRSINVRGRWVTLKSLLIVGMSVIVGQTNRKDVLLENTAASQDEWLTYGLTSEETRFSPLQQIDLSNVSRLGLAWQYDVPSAGGNQEATPLVWNGQIFGITNWSIVFAVDARTGKEKWRRDPKVNQTAVRPKICCGIVNRGVALYRGEVIAPVIDGRLQALDGETGKLLWEARVAYPEENYTITMAPRIAKGKVIIGVSGGEYPVRGYFSAYDAKTGKFAWRFYTVPGDPLKGFENAAMKRAAETWSDDAWKLGGGGTVWDGMAYDPEADLLYVGTGNGGPWPQALRKSKGLDNLYICSILAVKPDSGELVWYYQVVPGDSWDFDSVQQLILAELTIKGHVRKVIMQANKNGFYYVLDRLTGAFISAEPFAEVTWAKGIDQKTGRPLVNPEALYGAKTIEVQPGPGGAHNWSPMSFNPNTGLAYIPTTTRGGYEFAVDEDFEKHYVPGRMNLGLPRGNMVSRASTVPQHPILRRTLPVSGPIRPEGHRGMLIAWDPVAQKERWRTSGGAGIDGGTLTTAANLVFQVIPDGRLAVYSADKGEKLFEVQTGLREGMGPPITYMVGGKQYIALMGGSTIQTEAVRQRSAATSTPTGSTPKLLAFMLDGNPIDNKLQ